MSPAVRPILSASLEGPAWGIVELQADWDAPKPPPLIPLTAGLSISRVRRAPDYAWGRHAGYYATVADDIHFVLDPARLSPGEAEAGVFLAGDFNGWGEARGQAAWRLSPARHGEWDCLSWVSALAFFKRDPWPRFKFVTAGGRWIEAPVDAPNLIWDGKGNRNQLLCPYRTGRHRYEFHLDQAADLSADNRIGWRGRGTDAGVELRPGAFFLKSRTEQPLGALVEAGQTTFRLFAPRARRVELALFPGLPEPHPLDWMPLVRELDGCWRLSVPGDHRGWCYWYRLDGPRNAFSDFDPSRRVADPWALALAASAGPALVLDPARTPPVALPHEPPPWQDLVLLEAHVRDLAAKAPTAADAVARRGFTGLTHWAEQPDFYPVRLGVNAIELQPVQDFDEKSPEEYHWGYMPVNWFAPDGSYARQPQAGSQVEEFRDLVAALHRRGLSVLLDVVYNHAGDPNPLLSIDKLLYFHVGGDGALSNWSGCGNDLRTDAPMVRRLLRESLEHLVRVYDVDGFRFDLAELVGVEALREIESALKRVKPGIVLIAEPWSFRGHIAGELRSTGYSSWNDGYREFFKAWVLGRGSAEGLAYFLRGSPGYFASWPAQSVNYTESHDDLCWIDSITSRPGRDGDRPTEEDRRRTHLMLAALLASIGIPMLASGQDFLRSKRGVANTYQRGDLNALDYRRLIRHAATHAYAAQWIRLRRSARIGYLFRHYHRPGEGYLSVASAAGSSAVLALYNADGSRGARRFLLALNPHEEDLCVPWPEGARGLAWTQVCDTDAFLHPEDGRPRWPLGADGLELPALSCAAWVCE